MSNDEPTHDWLKRQLREDKPPPDAGPVTASEAERQLRRRTNVHDWMMIAFMMVAVVSGTVVVLYGQHADRRATAAGARSSRTTAAVVKALGAQQRSSDAVATLANDFAAIAVAKTDAERKAALDKLLADKAQAEEAKRLADEQLAALLAPTPTPTTAPARPSTTTSTELPSATQPSSSTTSPRSTTTTTVASLLCLVAVCPPPLPLPPPR